MSFEALLGDLQALHDAREAEALNKSLPAGDGDGDEDDKKVAAAAEASGVEVGNANPEGGEGAGDGDDGDDGDGDEVLGKSFTMFDADGNPIEAIDGAELVKSLIGRVDGQEESMTKALGMAVDLLKSQSAAIDAQRSALAAQGDLIKSLQEQVAAIADTGRGRKSTVSVSEKPEAGQLAKSEPNGLSGTEFMAKALAAQQAGKISGHEVAVAETSLQKGLAVPAGIVQRVLN